MRSLTSILILTFALSTLLVACSKEETPPAAGKAPAIKAAEQVAATAEMSPGRTTYETACAACHDSGLMHAPKIGDRQAWAGHIEHGLEHMVSNAIGGVGKMPPKGGNMALSDAEVREAVKYMLEQSK